MNWSRTAGQQNQDRADFHTTIVDQPPTTSYQPRETACMKGLTAFHGRMKLLLAQLLFEFFFILFFIPFFVGLGLCIFV